MERDLDLGRVDIKSRHGKARAARGNGEGQTDITKSNYTNVGGAAIKLHCKLIGNDMMLVQTRLDVVHAQMFFPDPP